MRLLIKLDGVIGLENVPIEGPAILMINHIAFVDPIVVLGCLPRNIVPMAKIEAYHYPIIGVFPSLWAAIPVRRGEGDRRALRLAMEVLEAGEIVLVAPEGTRSPALQSGKEGVAFLAYHTDTAVFPFGWRGRGATVQFGRPFRFKRLSQRPDRARLRTMTDEAMCVLARMLPPERRGIYHAAEAARLGTIDFV
jgi:1-acyl-sn-glycerol-3-phosphate acyltransferase